jgi:hypothetical protein
MGENRQQRIIRRLGGEVVDALSPKPRPGCGLSKLEAGGTLEQRVQASQPLLAGRPLGRERLEPRPRLRIERNASSRYDDTACSSRAPPDS